MKSEGPFDFSRGDSSHTSANRTRMPTGKYGKYVEDADGELQASTSACVGLAEGVHMLSAASSTVLECPKKRLSSPGQHTCAPCHDQLRLMRELAHQRNRADRHRLKGGSRVRAAGKPCENPYCGNEAKAYDHKHGTFTEEIVQLIRDTTTSTGYPISRFDPLRVRDCWNDGEVRSAQCPSPGTLHGVSRLLPYDGGLFMAQAGGWLCHSCNSAAGQVHDNAHVLEGLADYAEERQ